MRERRGNGRIIVVLLALLALALGGGAWWRARRGAAEGARTEAEAGLTAAKAATSGARTLPTLPDPRRAARGTIRGHVRDAAGQPLGAASVCASFGAPDLAEEDTRAPRCTRSGADGGYALTELLPAHYGVSASAAGKRPAAYREPVHRGDGFDLAAGQTVDGIDLVLEDGGVEVHGKVKDISGGPVAGALVELRASAAMSRGAASFTRTDAQGDFIGWSEPGVVWASASADGYGEGWTEGQEPGRTLELLLTPESVLVGRVVETGSGRPVPHAHVIASGGERGFGTAGDLSDSYGEDAFSDDEGRFRIERLAPGRYKPTASAPGAIGVAAESVLLGLGQTSDEVRIEVHPAAMVSGTLLAGGAPCARGRVRLEDAAAGRVAGAPTDAAGAVVVRAVLPGHYRVSARCDGFPGDDTLAPLDVAGKDLAGLKWSLAAGYTVRGTVVDAAGAPVAGASLYGQSHGADPRARRNWVRAESEKDGSFLLDGLTEGEVELHVQATGQPSPPEPTKLDVHGDVSGVKIVFGASGTIEGVVEDEDGAPVGGVSVRAAGKTLDWMRSASTADDGSFRLAGVEPGDYRVTAEEDWTAMRAPGSGDDDVQGVPAKVTKGAVAKVRLRVESRRATITGRVVDAAGKPVPDAYLDSQRESESAAANASSARQATRWGWQRQPSLTDTDGRFSIGKLSRGKYTVRAYRKGGGEAFAEHVATGADVTITIASPASLSGTVVAAGGGPPEEFRVTVSDRVSGFSRSEAFFRVGGGFTMSDLPAGKLSVSVAATGGQASQDVTLATGEARTGLRFELAALVTVRGTIVAMDTGKPLSGYMVFAQPVHGQVRFSMGDGDHRNVTDAGGHFEVARVPAGRVRVFGFAQSWQASEYSSATTFVTLTAGADVDLPPIPAPRRRTKGDEAGGDLGFTTKEEAPDAEPEDHRFVVAVVRPGGPAAAAGMLVGDEIVSVDGHDVTGLNAPLAWTLETVPEGTALSFGVKRAGAPAPLTLRLVAGKPSDG